ncbi:MAG: hypothetical protein NVSMB25_02160 [Thermoleophilaceae bacterium]
MLLVLCAVLLGSFAGYGASGAMQIGAVAASLASLMLATS